MGKAVKNREPLCESRMPTYCDDQEYPVDQSVQRLNFLLTTFLVVIILWAALRCAWLAKEIAVTRTG